MLTIENIQIIKVHLHPIYQVIEVLQKGNYYEFHIIDKEFDVVSIVGLDRVSRVLYKGVFKKSIYLEDIEDMSTFFNCMVEVIKHS